MKKLIFFIFTILLKVVRSDFSKSDLTEFQCALISNWVVFDLRDLESPE